MTEKEYNESKWLLESAIKKLEVAYHYPIESTDNDKQEAIVNTRK